MSTTLFTNAAVLDVAAGRLLERQSVLVEDDRIQSVGTDVSAPGATNVDLRGRTLMPGLVDCHVHVTAASADLGQVVDVSPTYMTAHAVRILRDMLRRGFTTVR